MLLRVDHGSGTPLSDQIAAGIRGAFLRREIGPGDRLPAARALAQSIDVNLHTVLRAYAALRDEGLIDLRRGRGAVVRPDSAPQHTRAVEAARTFVAEARRLGLDTDQMLDLVRRTTEENTRP
ncbi:GntR family transcriptional regulator [Rhodococcus triatomae]|uniref:GntR family transcriptional regulator n=1 Tax=Rhodococcus triatomae TaxID=300028 RepID=A0A1G8KKW0_9NOCA|nr:GntR family transcriptional regulator [Rhodococcus triatomae]QNG18957.1 GntR family transcriptional regulator [Rhodococcus triatomae]QNG25129.1 GntR family transcriptional regulator [Rhodococcus triatomae]SDI44077.1 GntR family transcriptional regulator [Rhodococcus triatomae]